MDFLLWMAGLLTVGGFVFCLGASKGYKDGKADGEMIAVLTQVGKAIAAAAKEAHRD